MKVIIASGGAVYIEGHKSAPKSNCGFAHMVNRIAGMLFDRGNSVKVISQSVFSKSLNTGKWTLLSRTVFDMLFSAKPYYVSRALKLMRKTKSGMGTKLRFLLYFLNGAYLERILKKEHPDVLHINGIGVSSLPYIYAALRTNTKFAVTLHGLFSFSELTNADDVSRDIEKFFMKEFVGCTDISTVASGIKMRMEEYSGHASDRVKVIADPIPVRNYYEKKARENPPMILSVGNLSAQKNQITVVKAFEKLQKQNSFDGSLILVGANINGERERIEKYIADNDVKNVTLTGAVTPDKVYEYYNIATVFVTASIDEGFGMPVIEGYSCGLPSVFFSDIDAACDLYSPDCAVIVEDRSIDALVSSLSQAIEKSWDRKKIIAFSENFAESRIADKYDEFLGGVTDSGVTVEMLDGFITK